MFEQTWGRIPLVDYLKMPFLSYLKSTDLSTKVSYKGEISLNLVRDGSLANRIELLSFRSDFIVPIVSSQFIRFCSCLAKTFYSLTCCFDKTVDPRKALSANYTDCLLSYVTKNSPLWDASLPFWGLKELFTRLTLFLLNNDIRESELAPRLL
jgi:hypothetical protein